MEDPPSCVGISGSTQSEADIRHSFGCQIKVLFNQRWEITNAMSEWSNRLIQQIQEYVSEQRKLLEQEYEKKVLHLNNIRDQFLEQALIYEQKKDTKQIRQLLDRCNSLKFQLATLVYVQRPISSIQLITEEQIIQKNQDESDVPKADNEQPENKPVEDHNNNKMNSIDTNKNSSPNLSFTSTKETNQQSSLTNAMNDDEDQATISDLKLEGNMSNRDNSTEKCPICFMIFPLSMSGTDRYQHANEHYAND